MSYRNSIRLEKLKIEFEIEINKNCCSSASVTDKQAEHRRLQGILQGRSGENGLAIDGRTEKALPDTLGHAGQYEN